MCAFVSVRALSQSKNDRQQQHHHPLVTMMTIHNRDHFHRLDLTNYDLCDSTKDDTLFIYYLYLFLLNEMRNSVSWIPIQFFTLSLMLMRSHTHTHSRSSHLTHFAIEQTLNYFFTMLCKLSNI